MYTTSNLNPGLRTIASPGFQPQSEFERGAKQLLDEGQAFLAYDLAKTGLDHFPDSMLLTQTAALALIRTGALNEAQKLLEPLCPRRGLDSQSLKKVYEDLQCVIAPLSAAPNATSNSLALDSLERLLQTVRQMVYTSQGHIAPNEETLGMLAHIYKEKWKLSESLEYARRSRDIYRTSFQTTGGYYTGINAATMSLLIGELTIAQALAKEVYLKCMDIKTEQGDDYWLLATMGETQLLLGSEEMAVSFYRQAAALSGHNYAYLGSSLQQLHLLQQHRFPVPEELFTLLEPPIVVVFVGHMLDQVDRPSPRFPTFLEGCVRAKIDEHLNALDARIGYSSAACGSDILFIEAMLSRGAEVNIVLPFAKEDFLQTCVAYAGPRWVIRFETALKLAHSINYVTEEPLLGDTVLFDFLGKMFYGYAEMRARTLLSRSHLLTVWDGSKSGLQGGTADIVDRWVDTERLSVIHIDRLSASPSLPITDNSAPTELSGLCIPSTTTEQKSGQRCIRTMLFADVVGYSKLEESRIPAFLHEFWAQVAQRLKQIPYFINTWGDAIFAVTECAFPMVEFALSLQEAVLETPWVQVESCQGLNIRIALHAGPVFEAMDPITLRPNFYGSHVNRTARLEPITVPGHIYASEQFIALLISEQTTCSEASTPLPFTWEYIGKLTLAKDFGILPAYHVRRNCLKNEIENPRNSDVLY